MSDPGAVLAAHLEPIVRVADGGTVAQELLLRTDEDGDLLEAAARRGVSATDVTVHALHLARRLLVGPVVPLHVNVIPADLHRSGFGAYVVGLLGPATTSLVLEITEQAPLWSSRALEANLRHLREAGVRLAIDDFGDGWADEASVELIRPEVIKVRLPLLVDGTRRTTTALADVVRELARRHGAQVVVEQVETTADHLLVQELGLDAAQGWLWLDTRRTVGAPSATQVHREQDQRSGSTALGDFSSEGVIAARGRGL